ncbi:CopY/TcrY family copper transport repressor [Enterococcus sp. LJL120]
MPVLDQVNQQIKISDSEWEVMRVIWTLGQASAQEIIGVLGDSKDWKPATIKTLLGRLVKKEVVWTEQVGKKFIYHPAVSESATVRSATENLFSHICAKRIGQTLSELVDQAELTQADIDQLKELLEQKVAKETIACNCIPGQCECSHHSA